MGRAPCCDKSRVKRGPWSPQEDDLLRKHIHAHGTPLNWITFPQKAGLNRCGKSCRLRWLNYLRPNINHGPFTDDEDFIICTLYNKIGSRWAVIASKLQGRTDNDVKNHWNTKLRKKLQMAPTTSNIANTNYTSSFTFINSAYPTLSTTLVQHPAPFYNNVINPSQYPFQSFDYPNLLDSQPCRDHVYLMRSEVWEDSMPIAEVETTTTVINDNINCLLKNENDDGCFWIDFIGQNSYDHLMNGFWFEGAP